MMKNNKEKKKEERERSSVPEDKRGLECTEHRGSEGAGEDGLLLFSDSSDWPGTHTVDQAGLSEIKICLCFRVLRLKLCATTSVSAFFLFLCIIWLS